MAKVTVQTVFLASIILLKYVLGWRMVIAAPAALAISTAYLAILYPRAWKIVYNTLPRDIKAGICFAKVLLKVKLCQRSDTTVPELFARNVAKHPDKDAIISEGVKWSFRKMDEYSNQVAAYFQANGYQKGDVVALCMENSPEFVGTWLGLAKLGVVPALVNTNLRLIQLTHCIKIADSKAVVYHSNFIDAFGEIENELGKDFPRYIIRHKDEDLKGAGDAKDLTNELKNASKSSPVVKNPPGFHDKLVYIYTSGTTGMPKAAVIKHSRFVYLASAVHYMTQLKNHDIIYDPLPLYHTAGGMVGIGQVMAFGLTAVVRKKFSASQFWTEAKAHNCTVAQYIGEICRYLLSTPEKPDDTTHKVRVMFGNGLRPQIWEAFQKRFNIDRICEFYGSTEGNANIVNMEGKVGAVGFKSLIVPSVLPVILVKVDEETGEPLRDAEGLCIECEPGEAGEFVGRIQKNHPLRDFDGYADEQATKKKILKDVFKKGDTCFRSGDVLVMDDCGYFYFRDRTGDTFRWRGENVSTSEVEGVLSHILDHKDCVVYGVEVPGVEGRAGMAAILDPDDAVDLADLSAGVKKALAPYARPVFIRKVRKLDATGTYKLKKLDLQHEAFDMERVKDPLYFLDPSTGSYVALNDDLYDKLLSGKSRL